MAEYVDITPTARVLRTLGEIPFLPWQCIAELIDNSLDGFAFAESSDIELDQKRVVISWSGASVGDAESTLEILDTGPGMDISVMQQCVKAGHTTNDPISNLGLFGMGFNIATARLGDKTEIYSATKDNSEWVGIEIDFSSLIKTGKFQAPVVRIPKRDAKEHGTRIKISKLKPGIVAQLRNQESNIRRRLERVYGVILGSTDVEIMVQNKTLTQIQHCIWSPSRYVSSGASNTTPARLEFDEDFGESLFNTQLNRYLTAEEEAAATKVLDETGVLPEGIAERKKRVHGWLGIQRYCDPNDYGIDFLRNGRKILLSDKSLFFFENPYSGTPETEYPVELGSTVGGRIVGEINVDHIPPNYQKNDFDRSDNSWMEMVEFIRGAGPILPKKRKAFSYPEDNPAPLAKLINAYRRADAGTRHLVAPHQQAREWAKKFASGDPEFQDDEKWWKAAVEADKSKADKGAGAAPIVDSGGAISDDVDIYAPGGAEPSTPSAPSPSQPAVSVVQEPEPPKVDDVTALKSRSKLVETYSGDYFYRPSSPYLTVRVWELQEGTIGSGDTGKPCDIFNDGIECDFFFNPRHPFVSSYPAGFRELLLMYLSDRFKVRDNLTDITEAFIGLMVHKFSDTRIEPSIIIEKAQAVFELLKERAVTVLSVREQQVIDFIHEASGEVEEIMTGLLNNPDLMKKFQDRAIGAIDSINMAPARTLVRLIDRFPEEFFDEKVFKSPYICISLADANATERLRSESKDRVLSFLKDALWALNERKRPINPQRKKDEMIRCAHSINFLNQEICE